ncbi:acyltransferase [Thalassotalea nanhaiensis]|uniref:Acyltransferase n=1 Tax=Thalassotalea nanhaiensis TaxID=3065648 RepID=A0ABY9TJ13_9GAMM|nr:acyltransferase [Colwelliaceae bacterium SQ345]
MEIRKLNTLRGIAALVVFITHFSDATNWLDGALGGRAGQYGVMLFFMLSGFLMSYLYFDKAFTKVNLQTYFLARVGRVLPLYLLIVFSSYFLSLTGMQGLYEITDIHSLIAHLMFIYGESVLWTISPEMQFYFAFTLFWYFTASRAGYIYVLVVAVLILLFFTNFPRLYGDFSGIKYNFFLILRSLPYFFVGVIFGMHYKSFKVPEYLKKNWFILTLLLIPLMFPQFSPVTSDAKNKMWLSYEVLLVMSTVFFCIVFLVPNNNILLANKVGDFIGKISYSLYLLHMPIIAKVNELTLSIELKLLVSIILSVGAAYLSYRYFEKPSAKYIRNIAPNKLLPSVKQRWLLLRRR